MSLITRCPACGTLFRVVPDQLKMSDGWVRCGQCAEVFDAQASLMQAVAAGEAATAGAPRDLLPPAAAVDSLPDPAERRTEVQAMPEAAPDSLPGAAEPEPEREPQPQPQPDPEPAEIHPPATSQPEVLPGRSDGTEAPVPYGEPVIADVDAAPRLQDVSAQAGTPDFADTVAEMPAAVGLELGVPTPHPHPAAQGLEAPAAPGPGDAAPPIPVPEEPDQPFELSVPPGPGGEPERVSAAHLELHEAPPESDAAGDGPPAAPEPSFVRQARRRAAWSRPGVRVGLVVLCVLAGLLLAAQVALHERDRLAARVPALAPALQAACRALGCRIGPPRRIEAVVIDASSFTRLGQAAYRLDVTLANQAAEPVALPSLELTLTDAQDQPVLRRVLAPADLGPGAPAVLAPRGQWPASVPFGVAAEADAARIAGYRLLAFYP